MLRSTGFFRGIDCPFYTLGSNGKSGRDGCNRPYCHFRHSKQRLLSYGLQDGRKTKEFSSDQNDQGYDPCNPEVARTEERRNGEPTSELADRGHGALGASELELVNRAIEAVRSEMEKDKRKLSRIGDQEYEPTTSFSKAGSNRPKLARTPHQAYDPGKYQIDQAAEYNPTPCSSKYTLDSEGEGNHANSMEYVPTAVKKAAPSKMPGIRSPPARSQSVTSKAKYTLDNCKPPTDMEYDPLSNFSAKTVRKIKKDKQDFLSEGDGRKRPQAAERGKPAPEDEYVPTSKKPRQVLRADTPKYTASFSESDEESSGTEYRPTSVRRLQRQKGVCESTAEDSGGAAGEPIKHAWKQQRSEDSVAEGSSSPGASEDEVPPHKAPDKKDKKASDKPSQAKSNKTERMKKEERDASRKRESHKERGAGGVRDKTKDVRKSSEEGKKEKSKEKTAESAQKVRKEGKEVKTGDGKHRKTEKLKGEHSQKERERGAGDAKKLKTSTKSGKDSPKTKDQSNGKLESRGREKDKKKSSPGSGCKDAIKKSGSSLKSREAKGQKPKQRSLSHVDLFGDESADDDGEEGGRIVRKSAAAFKRGSALSKRKAPEAMSASSDDDDDGDDDDGGMEDDGEDDYDDGVRDEIDYSGLQDEMEYDSDPLEECLRIFNESKDVKTEDKGRQAKQQPKEAEEDDETESTLTTLFPGQKKRVSHFKAKGNADTPQSPSSRQPQRRLTAQEICYRRMQIAQEQAVQLAAAVKTAAAAASVSPALGVPGERKRVAHRPNPPTLTSKFGLGDAKPASSRVLTPARVVAAADHLSVKAHTSAGIQSKTTTTIMQRRVAHTPTLKSPTMKRPAIPSEFGAKVPTNIRQRYLNLFIDECLKFCPAESVAFQTALDEEKVVYDRSSSKNIYLNVAVNTLKKLRSKCSTPTSPVAKSPSVAVNKKALSHEEILGGRLAAKTSFTMNRAGKQQDVELSGVNLYRKLTEYVMTEEQLQEHSYPRPHPERAGRAVIYNAPEKKNVDPFSKVCCRCGAEYKINVNGNCVRREECSHHWGRLRRYRVPGGWETQYNCCSGAVGSPGCQVAKQHVQDGRKESLDGYVKTFSKPLPADGNGGVYALDCEMCYTRQGLELTRVTVINSDLKVIYDTFVKPESKVVDYNTRFSGVTEEDLENATITLRDVQAVLLSMFSADSILIGHSLESDLFALKLLHSTVVDTAIVFPHRLGLPYKRALRNLMADYLKRIIQDNVEGHDSSEDASACMELMMWKIREDAKVKR